MKKQASSKILTGYFCLISCIFPLFFTNYYYNIQISKSLFFMISTYLTFIGMILSSSSQKFSFKSTLSSFRNFPGLIPLFIFILSALVSALLSDFGRAAFTGENGRYIGFFLLLSMFISFFLFASHSVDLRPYHLFLYVGGSLTAMLGILQFVRIDLLGVSAHVPDLLSGMYLSTIGQINTFSGYISMVSAFCIGTYCLSGKRLLLIPSLIGYVALFAGNSDSGFLCVWTVLAVLILFLKTPEQLRRIFDQLLLFGLSCIIGHFLSYRALIPYQGIAGYLTRMDLTLPFTLLFIFLQLAVRKFAADQNRLRYLKRIYAAILAAGAAIIFLLFLLTNLKIISFSPFLIDDSWGSFRGFIWRKVLEVYRDAPLLKKLFGYGPDTLKPLLLSICRDEMVSVTGRIYDSAHNDLLHYLITTGIIGALSWLAFWLSVLIRSIKTMAHQGEILPWLAVLIAYLIQTMFIPTQPITAPLGFMIAGICVGMTHRNPDKTDLPATQQK